MRYLIYFNESKEPEQSKILNSFCINYLAYLLDDGFKINVVSKYYNPSDPSSLNSTLSDSEYRISIKNSYANFGTRNKKFTWDSVKNEIVPFIEILSEKYIINNIKIFNTKSNYPDVIEYNDIIADEFTFINDILKIEITVEER